MDFNKLCRTCMCEAPTMFPLFSQPKDSPNFSDMIMTLTSVRLSESDGLPCQVCMQCVTSLDSAISFKKLCEKSDELFHQHVVSLKSNIVDSAIVKQEISTDGPYDSNNIDLIHDYEDDFLMFKAEPEVEIDEKNIKTDEDSKDITGKRTKGHHSCNICGKSYMGSKSLKRHMAVHKGDGFSCNMCEKIFSRRDHLRKHLQRVHAVKNIGEVMDTISVKMVVKYDCEYCGVDAPNKAAMARHLRACHKDKLPKRKNSASTNYIPDLSGTSDDDPDIPDSVIQEEDDDDNDQKTVVTTSGGGAVATIKEERGTGDDGESRLVLEVVYRCRICNIRYDNQHSYAAHMTKHSGPLPKGQTHFRCTMCDKVFAKRKNLKQHALTHNKEKANKCSLCHRAFTRPDQLILHMNNHTGKKRHQCNHCDKGFNMLSTLKDHLRTHSGEKPYLCSICGRGFTQNTNLKQHLMRHSATKPFGCPTCHAKFVSKGELDAHLRKHTGDHPFVCDTCGTGFTTSSSLVKHKRIHSGERPYACDLCPLRFTALGTLKNHRRTHTGEKPFGCTHCTRAFAQKSDLVSHIRTHTGERPYVCSTCGAPYQQSSALKAHIKAHHPHTEKMPLDIVITAQMPARAASGKLYVPFKPTPEGSQSPNFVISEAGDQKYTIDS